MSENTDNLWLKFLNYAYRLIKSRRFFKFIFVIFILESIWVALSAVYPMAFDEQFHFGIIQFYAHHLNPFITSQPSSTYVYGAITRDTSYMYQYLMSFPYRLVSLITKSNASQVITLRFINIVIFGAAILIFKKIFGKFTNLSPFLVNMVLLFFILTPIVPIMAGQINYDGLFILSIAVTFYLFLDFIKEMNQNSQLNVKKGLVLLCACLLASLVKYAFLPIFLGLAVIVFIWSLRHFGSFKAVSSNFLRNFKKPPKWLTALLIIMTLTCTGLFSQRYVVNMVEYHTPIPQCNRVLTVAQCSQYGPWLRNYQTHLAKNSYPKTNIITFSRYWFSHSVFTMTMAVNGQTSNYAIGNPIPTLDYLFNVILLGGLVMIIFLGKKYLWQNPFNKLLIIAVLFYLAALWLQNYSDYMHLGTPVAIQGRYIIPVLIPILILMGQLISQLLKKYSHTKVVLCLILIVLLLQGGGITTYILRSDQSWYWQNVTVNKINSKSRTVLKHVVVTRT